MHVYSRATTLVQKPSTPCPSGDACLMAASSLTLEISGRIVAVDDMVGALVQEVRSIVQIVGDVEGLALGLGKGVVGRRAEGGGTGRRRACCRRVLVAIWST